MSNKYKANITYLFSSCPIISSNNPLLRLNKLNDVNILGKSSGINHFFFIILYDLRLTNLKQLLCILSFTKLLITLVTFFLNNPMLILLIS